MEAWNSAPTQYGQNNGLPFEAEQEPQWGLCPVSEIYWYAWFFFMQYGLIPWWMQQETPATLEENIITSVQREEGLFRRKWLQAWAGNRLNIQRWVLQCSAAMQATVLRAVFGEDVGKAAGSGEEELLKQLAGERAASPAVRNRLRFMYWDALFTSLTAGQEASPLKETIRGKWYGWMQADISISASKKLDEISFPETLQGAVVVPRRGEAIPAAAPDLGLDEPLRVKRSGLVLLHAMLEPLFTKMEWLHPSHASLLPDFYSRAVHLLEFMAGGPPCTPEYDMALHKLLCGIPLDAPVEKDVEPAGAEKQAAHTLLDAVAQQYFPKGRAGRESLRNAFLQREGRLHFENGQWQLRVACQTTGALQLYPPVETTHVQLPWMQQLLTVQWTT